MVYSSKDPARTRACTSASRKPAMPSINALSCCSQNLSTVCTAPTRPQQVHRSARSERLELRDDRVEVSNGQELPEQRVAQELRTGRGHQRLRGQAHPGRLSGGPQSRDCFRLLKGRRPMPRLEEEESARCDLP